jgi:hypothetical protein
MNTAHRNFHPSPDTLDFAYSYAADGFQTPLWLFATSENGAYLVHKVRGSRLPFGPANQRHRITVLAGIHFFDAWRLRPHLAEMGELQAWLDRVDAPAVTEARADDP